MEAIILLSGGVDSALILAEAIRQTLTPLALTFDYGQRHNMEIDAARRLTKHYSVQHEILRIETKALQGSALTGDSLPMKGRTLTEMQEGGVPNTYVPGRNTLFLAFALAFAEGRGAKEIHFGPNLHDRDGYPDCSPDYVKAMQSVIDLATIHKPKIVTPLIHLTKQAIWKRALELDVPLELTWSCYDPQAGRPCNSCDACILRESAARMSS